jgi:5-aminolevulinate synthase
MSDVFIASFQAPELTLSFFFWISPLFFHLSRRSYRYFNNVNRLAKKFPVAHTANPKDEVDVWCSNDYLGMSKSDVVVETMK